MDIGMIFYTEGHVEREDFAREVERLSGQAVPVELVRHWYGRAVPLKTGGGWSGRGHTFTARTGQGAKKYTVFDCGTASRMHNKPVESGRKNCSGEKEGLRDLIFQKAREMAEILNYVEEL